MTLTEHQNRLLASGRCGMCAERVPRSLVLRTADCSRCGSPLTWTGGSVAEDIDARQAKLRLVGYALVAFASFFAGAIPLVQFPVQLAAIFVLHVLVLRRGLLWLPPGRRIFARIAIKMLGAALAMVALLVNVAIIPFVGVSALVLGAVGPLLTAIYVEGGLAILRRRLRWEEEGRELKVVEWALPLVLLLMLVGSVAGTIAVVMGGLHLLATADIPTASEFAKTFVEWGK